MILALKSSILKRPEWGLQGVQHSWELWDTERQRCIPVRRYFIAFSIEIWVVPLKALVGSVQSTFFHMDVSCLKYNSGVPLSRMVSAWRLSSLIWRKWLVHSELASLETYKSTTAPCSWEALIQEWIFRHMNVGLSTARQRWRRISWYVRSNSSYAMIKLTEMSLSLHIEWFL